MKKKISDGHVHIGPKFLQKDSWKVDFPARKLAQHGFGIKGIKEELKRIGVKRAALIAFPFSEYNLERLNLLVSKLAKRSKGRFVGIGVLDLEKDVSSQMDRLVQLGLKGFKVHPFQTKGSLGERRKIFKKVLPIVFGEAQKRKVPLILHSNFRDALRNLSLFPKTTLILAHCGRGLEELSSARRKMVLRKFGYFEKVYFDTSTVTNVAFLKDVIEVIGSKRVIFGSDTPYTKEVAKFDSNVVKTTNVGSTQLYALFQAMGELKLSKKQEEDILWRNFETIFPNN